MLRPQLTGFQVSPEGYVLYWLTTGLFADLLAPHDLPAEGEATAGEPWHLAFGRFRRITVPGYRGQEGSWILAVCGLRSPRGAQTARLAVTGEPKVMVAVGRREFVPAAGHEFVLQLETQPLLLTLAIPAKGELQTFCARLLDVDPASVEVVHRLDTSHPLRIGRVRARDIWVEHKGHPCPTIWIELLNVTDRPCTDLRFGLATPDLDYHLDFRAALPPRAAQLFEVPYPADLGVARANIIVSARGAAAQAEVQLQATSNDWEIHLVPHFHYDPVWWNTQRNYVEFDARSAFKLINKYLDVTTTATGCTFVLQQVPYTKPYWDTFPQRREELTRLVREGHCGLAGALYNEPQTTLISPETTLRAIAYGTIYHREQWGAGRLDPWMLDVFGHDPNFPQLLTRAGYATVAYARGPYKRCWGIPADRLSFPVEHWWTAPDGSRVLARLLEPDSYTLGYSLRRFDSPEEAWWLTADLFERACRYSLAHVQLWPIGGDFAEPIPWLHELAARWNETHLSPKIYCSTPTAFFDSLSQALDAMNVDPPALTRDMNPVNNGCGVSYVDTKLAHRVCEVLTADAEALSTVAALVCAQPYPVAHFDLAWRQLIFNAHHDALTGTESDQVYLDLLGGWREAYEAASEALAGALAALTEGAVGASGEAILTVFNPLAWRRDDVVEAELPEGWRSAEAVVFDGETAVPAEMAQVSGRKVVRFVATNLPALGAKCYTVRCQGAAQAETITHGPDWIENEFFRVQVDPARGGGIVSLVDKRSGREFVQPGRVANDLVAHKEYPDLPVYGEGPWNIATTGERHFASEEFPTQVSVERTAARVTLVVRSPHIEARRVSRITLWAGLPRLDFETCITDYSGRDWMFKVHFPLAVEGGRPVYEIGGSYVARTYCPGDQDTAELPWTQDSAAFEFVDLTVPLVIEGAIGIGGDVLGRLSAGMVEIVCPRTASMAEDSHAAQMLLALSSVGVTATITWPESRRFGDIAWDSNLPDLRIVVGGPGTNEFTAHLLQQAGWAVESELREWVDNHGWAVALLPRLELGLPEELPIILVWGKDAEREAEACEHIAAQVRHLRRIGCLVPAALRETMPPGEPADYGIALLNHGTVSHCCYADGTLTMALMRSCTGWPSGTWIDEPQRTAPDGSGFQLEHWSHCWRYALVTHEGHIQDAALSRRGCEFNHPPIARWGAPAHVPSDADLLLVQPENVVCVSLRPEGAATGYPLDRPLPGRIVARLQECAGKPTEAVVRCHWAVASAWKATALDEPLSELTVSDEGVVVPLGQFETATVLLSCDRAPAVAPVADITPQYARWWRHNRGAEPLGFVPAVPLFEPDHPVQAEPGDTLEAMLTISSCYLSREALAGVRIELPSGWQVSGFPPGQVTLSPGQFETHQLQMTVPRDAAPGQYLIYAWLDPPFGPPFYDVLQVAVGEEPGPVLEAHISPPQVSLPSANPSIYVTVRNRTRARLVSQVQLLSPVEAWPMVERSTHALDIPPGAETVVQYPLRPLPQELDGWLWVLAKVTAAGHIVYTDAVRINLNRSRSASADEVWTSPEAWPAEDF
ncbi:MAG: hypothetical protein N2512_12165 [Armatimonadetes bacterium]|nr:hypothetical protein [Armatimonadota bacterium]